MPNNILITPGSASIQFSGSAINTIRLQVEPSGSVAFYGNSASLFSIADSPTGSLATVSGSLNVSQNLSFPATSLFRFGIDWKPPVNPIAIFSAPLKRLRFVKFALPENPK